MTREDAVTTLKDISEMVHKQKEIEKSTLYGILDSNNEPVEALDMAIKALEQEPCEDCITLRLEKGALKYSNKDYVVYKKEWLKKWWQPELALLGIELPSIQPTAKENLVVGDCISRQAVLDALNNWDWQELYLPVHFKDMIDDLPSIQPKTDMWSIKDVKDCFIKHGLITEQEPKTGHWIDSGIYGEIDGQITKAYTCSKCGAISIFRVSDGYIINADNCPNCGARMERENKENVKR